MKRQGIKMSDVENTLNNVIGFNKIGGWQIGSSIHDIVVHYPRKDHKEKISYLNKKYIKNNNNHFVPLNDFAAVEIISSASDYKKYNGLRCITIQANLIYLRNKKH